MKQSGLGDALYLGGYDLSGDTQSLGAIGGGTSPIEVTAIDKKGFERIGGLRDGRLEWVSYFNPSLAKAHKVLSTLPTTDRTITYCRGTALGSPAACIVGKQIGYDPTRGQDGSLTIALNAQANGYGLEWGQQLTAGKRTDPAGTNGTSVDFGAATSWGLQAYLHVFAFTGTSVSVKLQESADNGAADPWTDVVGAAFTAATGITAERIQTARGLTVKRYLRTVTTGTFTNAVFAVAVVRNDTEVTF